MKNICCFLIILVQTIFLFGQEREMLFKGDSIRCIVMKIDSIDNFYLLDVQSNKEKYKIISRKMNNTCSNLHLGEVYQLSLYAIFPSTLNFLDQRYHIGGDVFLEIDWGNNLYQAQELCGLCYEVDLMKIRECEQLIDQLNAFENAILYIYFHYDAKKNSHITFSDFCVAIKANSIHFILNKNKTTPIPVYASPETVDINYELFIDSLGEENFYGEIFYEYKNLYFIKGSYNNDRATEILGWIDKKYLSSIGNFENSFMKRK